MHRLLRDYQANVSSSAHGCSGHRVIGEHLEESIVCIPQLRETHTTINLKKNRPCAALREDEGVPAAPSLSGGVNLPLAPRVRWHAIQLRTARST